MTSIDSTGPGAADIIIASLAHPVRRKVLRVLHEPGGPRSPSKAAKRLGLPWQTVSHHFTFLSEREIIEMVRWNEVRGAVEHVYESLVADDPLVKEMLRRTEKDDE
jgi:DNA-binding transcriptional ArsR family regulator